jgi:hypothetical protein
MRFAVVALVCFLHLPLAAARGAVLIEMTVGAEPLRVVIDRPGQRVLFAAGNRRTWFDLGGGMVYHREGDAPARRAHARYRPGHDEPPPYRIERFGPGPIVAGQVSAYHVVFLADRICAEMVLSEWMRPFVDPAIRAMALIQQLRGIRHDDPCTDIPLATYAAPGWPLLAGKSDRPTLATSSIAFDSAATPEELTPPLTAVEVPAEALQNALGSYGW